MEEGEAVESEQLAWGRPYQAQAFKAFSTIRKCRQGGQVVQRNKNQFHQKILSEIL